MTAPDIDLDALEAAALAATQGDWTRQDFYSSGARRGVDGPDGEVICASYGGSGKAANFDHIAASSPAVVLELIRRLRAAEGAMK